MGEGLSFAPQEEKEWQIAENSSPLFLVFGGCMFRYILKRILQAIPLLLLISFIVFSLIQLAPFDVIDSMTTPNMSQEQIDLLKVKYGLDQPFLVQYFVWLKGILSGNLGFSLMTQHSIGADLAEKFPTRFPWFYQHI